MQSGNGVPSTTNMVAGLGATNLVQLQTTNQGHPTTQYVTVDMNNRAQIINLPQQQSGQYFAVQPGGFQVIPVQGGNSSTQYVQLQLPNVQQSGANFIQLQAAGINQPIQAQSSIKGLVNTSNLNQTFIPVQSHVLENQPRLGNTDQKVSIQLVQHPGATQKTLPLPVRLGQSSAVPVQYKNQSLIVTSSARDNTPVLRIEEPKQQQGVWIRSTGQMKIPASPIMTTATSSLFQALQQAAASNQTSTSISNTATLPRNIITKTFSTVRLPQPNLDQILQPNLHNVPSSPSAAKKQENKPLQARTYVVVSGGNQQSIIIPKSQNTSVQPNPVFVPITMANNVSVLTNQTPALMASKRLGQNLQGIPIRIQQQIAPRVGQTGAGSDAQVNQASATIVNQNNQSKFLIPMHSSDIGIQQHTQQQQQQVIFQPVQQNLVRFASQLNTSLQQKKDALASIVPGPKPVQPPPVSTSSISESKPIKKPCNCTKSQCLKLYCECFANGEFCNNCNCRMCLNNIQHEAERSKAIKTCLERNAYAFHPKIGKGKVKGDNERRHTKGCNCKRSGCLKNYCECYEAKILCSSLCRCNGCKNFEESDDRKTLMHLADAAEARVLQQDAVKSKLSTQIEVVPKQVSNIIKEKLPLTFMTADVSKATCDILLATAIEAEKAQLSQVESERSLIIEFSRCLDQIIDKSNNARKGKR